MNSLSKECRRFDADAGIAIGPILFVVAILGILAAAIAAGSGSFTTGTSTETARTKAAALIQIGQNLKVGFDRITGLGTDHGSVVINVASTGNNDDLFSPNGGGVSVPSVTMAETPASDVWFFPSAALAGFGTTSTERVALLKVASTVCTQINQRANAIDTPAGVDVGTINATAIEVPANWPASLAGKPTGCLQNTGTTTGYFFYQVLGLR